MGNCCFWHKRTGCTQCFDLKKFFVREDLEVTGIVWGDDAIIPGILFYEQLPVHSIGCPAIFILHTNFLRSTRRGILTQQNEPVAPGPTRISHARITPQCQHMGRRELLEPVEGGWQGWGFARAHPWAAPRGPR